MQSACERFFLIGEKGLGNFADNSRTRCNGFGVESSKTAAQCLDSFCRDVYFCARSSLAGREGIGERRAI
jgi:hypothetical protein